MVNQHAGAERRTEQRHGAHFDVRFNRASDAARALNAFSVNFSAGGLCLRTKSEYQVGEALALSLTIEGEQFDLQAVVAWARGEAIGVRFVSVGQADRLRLEAVAKQLSSKSVPAVKR